MLVSGKYRGEKILYPDGIGCHIWLPFEGDESTGFAYDFSFEDIDDIINMLEQMKNIEATVYTDETDVG